MMSSITIQSANRKDMQAVAAMMQALAREEGDKGRCTSEALQHQLQHGVPELLIYVASDVDDMMGCVLAYPGYDVLSASPGLHLSDLYVKPAYRRQGVGSALMQHLAQAALQRDMQWMSWTTLRANRHATAFYQALGASDVGVRFMAMGTRALRQLCREVTFS